MVLSSFDGYPSGGRWRDHVLSTAPSAYATEEECAVSCLARTADCSYYVYGADGNAQVTPVIRTTVRNVGGI